MFYSPLSTRLRRVSMPKLKELCILITDGEHGSVNDDKNGSCYLLSNKNLNNGFITIDESDRKIRTETKNKLNNRTKIGKNTILISTVGTIGKLAFIDNDDINYSFQRSVGIIKPNPDTINPYFLYSLLQTSEYQERFAQMASGSVQKCIFIGGLEDLDIKSYPADKQNQIGKTFHDLDMLIKNNMDVICSLTNKIKDTYSYFMPKQVGEKRKLSEFVSIINETYSGEDNLPLIDLSIIPSNSLIVSNLNKSDKLNTNLKKLKMGDFLFGSIRPYLKKSIVSPIEGLTTGTVIQMRPRISTMNNFLLGLLTSESFFEFAINNSTGTKMPVVKAKDLINYEFIYNKDFVEWFEKQNNYFELIISLLNENFKLNEYKQLLLSTLFKQRL